MAAGCLQAARTPAVEALKIPIADFERNSLFNHIDNCIRRSSSRVLYLRDAAPADYRLLEPPIASATHLDNDDKEHWG